MQQLVELKDRYLGKPVWLVCGGPSVRGFDFSRLSGTVAAINEIGVDVPNLDLWTGNDELTNERRFPREFWQSECQKFIGQDQMTRPASIRNLVGVRRKQQAISVPCRGLKPRAFFDDPILWGAPVFTETGKPTIKKSAMLQAFGVLWRLGFSEVRLLGCDWGMKSGDEYGHNRKEMDEREVFKCNLQFGYLEQWFNILQPHFQSIGFNVLNCTDGGNLEIFERRDWREFCETKSPLPAEC